MNYTLFSKSALPNVINVMERFNLALDQEIRYFELYADRTQFGKILAHLSQDLAYFTAHLLAWNQEIKTDDEQTQIEDLQYLLEHGKTLVTKAASLLQAA